MTRIRLLRTYARSRRRHIAGDRRRSDQDDLLATVRYEDRPAHHSLDQKRLALISLQHTHGNAYVTRAISASRAEPLAAGESARKPVAVSPGEIDHGVRNHLHQSGTRVALAGTPVKKEAPKGMNFIADQSGPIGLGGKPAGYTAIKSAAAFNAPSFTTKMSAEKDGYKRHYFAEVLPTTAADVQHTSYYPAPGTHENAVSEQKDGVYRYFWKITSDIS